MNEWKDSRGIRLREGVAFIMHFINFFIAKFFMIMFYLCYLKLHITELQILYLVLKRCL